MEQASEELRFEEACEYRDLIESVRRIGEHQKITGSSGEDRDVVALALDREDAVAQIFFIRDGKLIGRDHFYLRVAAGEERSGVLRSFLKQFYAGTPFIPRELMLSDEIEDHGRCRRSGWAGSGGRRFTLRCRKKALRKNWWSWRRTMRRLF